MEKQRRKLFRATRETINLLCFSIFHLYVSIIMFSAVQCAMCNVQCALVFSTLTFRHQFVEVEIFENKNSSNSINVKIFIHLAIYHHGEFAAFSRTKLLFLTSFASAWIISLKIMTAMLLIRCKKKEWKCNGMNCWNPKQYSIYCDGNVYEHIK